MSSLGWTLVALLVSLLGTSTATTLTFEECLDAYIHMKCPFREKLEISGVKVVEGGSGVCDNTFSPYGYLAPPQPVAHLCPSPRDCLYTESFCENKNECLFFISGRNYVSGGQRRMVQISYSCRAGTVRMAGVSAIVLVALLLAIAMFGTLFIICKSRVTDTGAYVEFENRLSRTPSMSSEASSRFGGKDDKQSVKVVVPTAEAQIPPKVLDEKTASVI